MTLPTTLRGEPDYEPADPTSLDDLVEGFKELEEARPRYVEADAFYEGEVGAVYASAQVKRLLDRIGVEEVDDFDYAKIPVDVVATRLAITGVVAVPAEEDDAGSDGVQETSQDAAVEAADKAIAKLRKGNQLDAEEKCLHRYASTHGEAYLLVWPLDSDESVDIDMRVNTAHNVRAVYDDEDPLKLRYVIKSWPLMVDGKRTHRANLYYDDRIERWVTKPGTDPTMTDSWRRYTPTSLDDAEDVEGTVEDGLEDTPKGEIPNPYGRVPWFHFRNDRPHGTPEHKGAYGPQQLINKLIHSHAAVIDFQSFPQRYLLVDPMLDDPLVNVDDPDHPDDDENDPETHTGTSGLSADPGAVWRLWGKAVGEFQAADPHTFLDPLDRYIKSMAELTDTPQHAFTKNSADMPSGDALREMNGPTNEKVKDRQKRYGATWQDAYEFALELMGITGVSVEVHWAPLEVVNDAAGWATVQAKIAAGVPTEVALVEAGYSSDQVKEWLQDAEGADLGRRVALLNQIGTAVQTLGAGIALGAASKEQVQAVIAKVLGLTLEGVEGFNLPKGTFVDPAAQQAAMLAQQQRGQQGMQQTALEHQAGMQQATHDHQRTMAEEAAQRAQEMFAQQGGPPPNGRGRRSGGRT